ncbi:hypothetical protein ABPG75_004835 [Micractinium tetrahymenae]
MASSHSAPVQRCSSRAPSSASAHWWHPKLNRAAASRSRLPPARTSIAAAAGGSSGSSGVLVLPGFLFSSRQYAPLVADLRARGYDAEVVPTAMSDWFPVIYGASFDWYLKRMDSLLQSMHARHDRVALVGHSAGGWLARILLGGEPYQGVRYGRSGWVHTLLTLGTPHQSIENYPFGRAEESLAGASIDAAPPGVRGSSLQFANYFYPDAAALGGVRVVCACGDVIRGRPLWGPGSGASGSSNGSSTSTSSSLSSSYPSAGSLDEGSNFGRGFQSRGGSRWDAYVAFESYKSGCGRGDVDGDGVTPLCIAQLPGAEELLLPGVWHIPRGRGQVWYGDAAVQEQWLHYLREPQGSAAGRT